MSRDLHSKKISKRKGKLIHPNHYQCGFSLCANLSLFPSSFCPAHNSIMHMNSTRRDRSTDMVSTWDPLCNLSDLKALPQKNPLNSLFERNTPSYSKFRHHCFVQLPILFFFFLILKSRNLQVISSFWTEV